MAEGLPQDPLSRLVGQTVEIRGLEAMLDGWPRGVHPQLEEIREFINGAIFEWVSRVAVGPTILILGLGSCPTWRRLMR